MRIELLGTGGASPTPRPGCDCPVCTTARAKGIPYSRNGPSVFVHGPDLLIDTPEDIVHSLNRANLRRVGAVAWSHWHPDHTAGVRVLEAISERHGWQWPPAHQPTPVYVLDGVGEEFRRWLGLDEQLRYLAGRGFLTRHDVADGEAFTLGGVQITPLRLPAPTANVYAFILAEAEKRVLIAPDELVGWTPAPDLGRFDLAIMPCGIMEFDPFTGERRISAAHPVLQTEATFRQTLDMVRALDVARVVFVHIEEYDRLGYDDLLRLQRVLKKEQPDLPPVMFGFDRLSLTP